MTGKIGDTLYRSGHKGEKRASRVPTKKGMRGELGRSVALRVSPRM